MTEEGKAFLIDGRKLKSINQWYNKENARLQKIRDRQGIKKTTKEQDALARKRNKRVRDYMSKAGRRIIDYCLEEKIGTVVVGYQKDFQRKRFIIHPAKKQDPWKKSRRSLMFSMKQKHPLIHLRKNRMQKPW